MQSSSFNMKIYCTIVSVLKYREIFQVYNNQCYCGGRSVHWRFFGKAPPRKRPLMEATKLASVLRCTYMGEVIEGPFGASV